METLAENANFTKITKIAKIREKGCQDSLWRASTKLRILRKLRILQKLRKFAEFAKRDVKTVNGGPSTKLSILRKL